MSRAEYPFGAETAALVLALDREIPAKEEINYTEGGGRIDYYDFLFTTAYGFCEWADENVDFLNYDECWPYEMDRIAPVLLPVLAQHPNSPPGTDDWRTVCVLLDIPLKTENKLLPY